MFPMCVARIRLVRLLLPPGKWLWIDISAALSRCRKLFFYQDRLSSVV